MAVVPGTVVAQSRSPAQERKSTEQALVRLLYEGQNDPDFDGEVQFLRGVPLISRASNANSDSQYFTSLILHARDVAERRFHSQIQRLFTQVVSEDDQSRELSGRLRMRAAFAVLHRVLGMPDPSTALRTGVGQHVDDEDAAKENHAHPHTEGWKRNTNLPVGFRSSRLEVTAGLHALMDIDGRLRGSPDAHAAIRDAIGTSGIQWRVLDRDIVDPERCKRLLSHSIPFVAHRGQQDLLVCGFATHDETTYLMGFDLAEIERRVSIRGSNDRLSYSQYLRRKAEVQARGGDPIVELDPLFWDYTSYFSVKNLDCFALKPILNKETITALYPVDLDTEKVVSIIRETLEDAKKQSQKSNAERLERKRVQGELQGRMGNK